MIRDQLKTWPQFHHHFGLAYYRRGAFTAAASSASNEFSQVVQLRPRFAPARLRLAKLSLRQGRYADVEEECRHKEGSATGRLPRSRTRP